MSQVIKIKHSITPSNEPASLETGELAINVTDGSLFFGSATTVHKSFKFDEVTATGHITADFYNATTALTGYKLNGTKFLWRDGGTDLQVGNTAVDTDIIGTSINLQSPVTASEAIAMGTNKITGLGDPTLAQDGATKAFVDLHSLTAGTVSSVAITGSDGIEVDSGSPITRSGTIALGLSNVPNSSLTNSAVSYGGISLSLGGTDATPAFNLSDATAYPGTSTLITTGTITTGVWNSNRLFTKQEDSVASQGDYVTFGAATVTIQGSIYYYNGGDWAVANAAIVGTGTFLLAVAIGTNSLTDGMLIRGTVGQLSYDAGDDGDVLYLSTTNGKVTSTAPTTSGNVVRVVGYALGDTPVLWFNPDNTWVELT